MRENTELHREMGHSVYSTELGPCEREHRELHREMGHSVYSMELGCETKLPRTASSVALSRLPDVVTLGSGPFCSDTHCTMCHSESQLQDGS